MIIGHGNSASKVIFISDQPYGEDLKSNYALTGFQESMLSDWLRSIDLSIRDVWRTCLVKEEVPKETVDYSQLIQQYGPILNNEIQDLQPNLLVPLGEHSFNYLTGLNGIRKFRGSVLPSNLPLERSYKVLPILGQYPYLNQEYRLKYITRIDFSKITKNLYEGPIPDNYYNVWVAESASALRAFFERSYQPCLDRGGFLVFDIETYMGIPTCCSFCFDGFESVCVPFLDLSIDLDNRVLMVDMIAKLLNSPIPKVNQNIKYDWKRLVSYLFNVVNVVGDTMLASSTLYCEFPKNLGFLTSIYTDLPYFKDEGKEYDPSKHKKKQFYLYNAKDSLATHQIYTKQLVEMKELGTEYVYKSLIRLMPIYINMENRGILIDQTQRERLLGKYTSLFDTEELKLRRLLSVPYVNSLSSKQMRMIVFDVLGYKTVEGCKKTKSGEPSTDEESLELLLVFGEAKRAPSTGPPILQCIINCRKLHKVIEILELPLYPDGRFRCEFNLAGTETGRSSAGESTDQIILLDGDKKIKVKNLGHSLQTIGKHGFAIDGVTYGKDLRSMFVATPGYSFIEIDLSGAEARVDRVLSGIFDMGVFDDPGIHKLTGSWFYDCKPNEIKKNILVDGVDRYFMAKTFRHAGERNITAKGVAIMTQRPKPECEALLRILHTYQPEIKQVYHHDIEQCVKTDLKLIMPNGRRRDFFDRPDYHTINEAISTPPQAIVSDQTKFEGILKTFSQEGIYSYAHLLTEQHDGVLAEVKRGYEEKFYLDYKKNVESEIDFSFGSLKRDYKLTIPAEVSLGYSWYDLKEVRL